MCIRDRYMGKQADRCKNGENETKIKIALYGEKFHEFEDTLKKTNEMLNKLKMEIERMASKIKTLEKTNQELQNKSNHVDYAMITLIQEIEDKKKLVESMKAGRDNLKKICRGIQDQVTKKAKLIEEKKAIIGGNTAAANGQGTESKAQKKDVCLD
eukprot:TRINITY_DN5827_c0_g1_i1.p1 TRINITY_DN5827_c0_g1~~TRINITY_DN5827_c0_g1_i1.p1  ORF type:complete len:176 (-),score=51.36 TRINITY_DN5827_c0_g1_i1:681-1148(-)